MDMPIMKKKRTVASQAAARGPLPELPEGLLDELVKGPMTPGEVQDLMLAFNKALIERAMGAEMNMHLGYHAGQSKPSGQTNERNGASGKTVITERGPVRVDLPRDRDGSFEPILIPKHERRFTGFDERIIAMYARGMSVREIQAFLAESYGTEVSPDFISSVTNLSVFLCVRRLAELTVCLSKALTKQNSELVHGGRPVECRSHRFGKHVTQRQPEQLDGGLVVGEVAAGLDDLA